MHKTPGLLAVFLIFAVLWFGLLGYRDLVDPDEGRYAAIPAAMVNSGDWITPRLNNFKYFEKPVLQYWATAISYTLFGKSNTTARLWTALTGFALVLFVALVSYHMYDRQAAIYTYLIAISSMMIVILGHLLNLDMSLSAFIVMGVGSLVIAQSKSSDKIHTRNWMLVAWTALALGTLTKGPVAVVLPAGAVLVYSLWQRDLGVWKRLHLFKGLLLYLLIVSPWFIAVSRANPGFAHFFFIHEHLERYTTQVHHRSGPVYYFIPFLFVGLLPWLTISLRSLVLPAFKWKPENPGEFDAERFLWTFVVVTFIFFSLGQSKLPAYILPVMPVITILSGGQLSRRKFIATDRWGMCAMGVSLLVGAFTIEHLATDRYPLEQWQSYAPWLLASGLLFLLAALSLFLSKKGLLFAFALAALLSLASIQSLLLGFNSLSETRSGHRVAEVIMDSVPSGTPIFSFRNYSESAVFYMDSPITLVEHIGELELGIEAEPDKYISTFAQFVKKWHDLDQAVLIVYGDDNVYKERNLQSLAGKIVYKDPKRMVIIKS